MKHGQSRIFVRARLHGGMGMIGLMLGAPAPHPLPLR